MAIRGARGGGLKSVRVGSKSPTYSKQSSNKASVARHPTHVKGGGGSRSQS